MRALSQLAELLLPALCPLSQRRAFALSVTVCGEVIVLCVSLWQADEYKTARG